MQYLIAGIIGLFSGVASGLFGVGGGIGTSLVVIIPTAIAGSFKHFQQGNVDWRTALSLAPLAIAGSYFGAWLTTHIPAENLKRTFGGFIILVGIKLLFGK